MPVKRLKRQVLFRKKPIRPFNLAWSGFPEIVDCPTQISQNTEGKSDLAEVALKNCSLHVVSNKLRTYLQTKLSLAAYVDYIHMVLKKASSDIEAITRARKQVTRLATTYKK